MTNAKRVSVEMPNGDVFKLRLPKRLQGVVAEALAVYNQHLRVTVGIKDKTYELKYPNNGCSNPSWTEISYAEGGAR
jgi:hypothetical protein